ncbi:MAG: hypothetical protein ACHREM_10385 [Polyangiales bacterium]
MYGPPGFAWALVYPSTTGVTIDPSASYSTLPSSTPMTATRASAGVYTITIPNLGLNVTTPSINNGGNVQVSALGLSPDRCHVQGWNGIGALAIIVLCHDNHGSPVDTTFGVFFQRGSGTTTISSPTTGGVGSAYAWIDNPTSAAGVAVVPSAQYEWNSTGYPISVVHERLGVYDVQVAGLADLIGGHTMATAYGAGSQYCTASTGSPSADAGYQNVYVYCFDTNANPVDSRFSFRYDDRTTPTILASSPAMGAYNLAQDPGYAGSETINVTSAFGWDPRAVSPIWPATMESRHVAVGEYIEDFENYSTVHALPMVGGNVGLANFGVYCKGAFSAYGTTPLGTGTAVGALCYRNGVLSDTPFGTLFLAMP